MKLYSINKIRYIVVAFTCLWTWQTGMAQTDSTRTYTTAHPLIYEDAWDLALRIPK